MTNQLYDAYKTDKNAEMNGIWLDEPGCRFKVARMGGANLKYQKLLAQKMKPHMREVSLGMADEEVLEGIMKEVFVSTILLEWEGVNDEEGLPLTFSKENALALFNDLPDLYLRLREQASSYSNFRASALAAASKN